MLMACTDAVQLGFLGMGIILTPLMAYTYTRINASRAKRLAEGGDNKLMREEELRALGDRAPDFRYSI